MPLPFVKELDPLNVLQSLNKNLPKILLALFVFIVLLWLPPLPGLSVEGKNVLALFAFAIILWVTEALPVPITSLMTLALLPALNIVSAKQAFLGFGTTAVFFLIGAFLFALALSKSGLSKRIALFLLSRFDQNPERLLLGVMLTTALMTFVMPEHAVAALMFPVVMEIAKTLKPEPWNSKYGKALFLGWADAAAVGGVSP